MLIILGGLPGTGKTTVARVLALRLRAVHVRIDTIEQAIMASCLAPDCLEDAGYQVGYGLAEDNLRLGHTVIADSVNPVAVTRQAWLDTARRAGAKAVQVEVMCSDETEHRRRVTTRTADIAGMGLPTWKDVVTRDYQRWSGTDLVADTAHAHPEQIAMAIRDLTPQT